MKNKSLLIPFICKTFRNSRWFILGTVYAENVDSAWGVARENWGRVDSVLNLFPSD